MLNLSFARNDDSFVSQWWWTVDRALLAAFGALILFGIVMVTSASPPVAERIGQTSYHFLIKHLILVGPAVVMLIGISMLQTRKVWRLAVIVLALTMMCMVLVLFVGSETKGAQRWISVLGFTLQPSEFVKPAFAVVAAWLIAYQKSNQGFPANIICAGLFLVIVALLMLQPDLGMTMVVTSILAAQIFLAGLPFRYLIIFGFAAVMFLLAVYMSFDHVQSRIDRFLNPESGDSYQVDKSLEAFRHGGIFGTGPGQGEVKLRLPDAHADFIFSVAGEELGLPFTLIVLGLYLFILLRGFHKLMKADDMFVVLAAGGLLVMFGLQAFIHMGSALQLLPAKGMTMPFVSYGGSSMLSTGLGMGMLLALMRRQTHPRISTDYDSREREVAI